MVHHLSLVKWMPALLSTISLIDQVHFRSLHARLIQVVSRLTIRANFDLLRLECAILIHVHYGVDLAN